MKKKILIMGLPGSGKTTLASKLAPKLKAKWLNADEIRKKYNDWDFSDEGRLRQARRMSDLADDLKKKNFHVIADFICPTDQARQLFNPDFLIWVDTIKSGRFDDTNKIFVPPKKFDFKVNTQDAEKWSEEISLKINSDLKN
tara:strand:+ start:279 stop:704 length:426 start_codon:yes stop_codon:yes gene_type:complete